MEEHWIAQRSHLRQLLQTYPHWTTQMYADAVGMSVSWVKDWKRTFKEAEPHDESVVQGRPRYRRTPFDSYDEDVIEAILDIRDNPPPYCSQSPGPAVIQYELQQRFADQQKRYPTSTSTIWKVLDNNQRIIRYVKPEHQPFERPDPMRHWEIDFSDVTTVPPDPDGKRQHVVEMLNIVDRGTSIVVESTASEDYTAASTILELTGVFVVEGLPDVITCDRDPRFVGGFQGDKFPSAFMRFLMSLQIKVDICPPRHPHLKPFVERFHRTADRECIQVHRPKSAAAAREVLREFAFVYNTERPHQGSACRNRPPYQAFPSLPRLAPLPVTVDPDAWLNQINGRLFRRRVQPNGSVKVDRRSYSVGRHFKGQMVSLKVDAQTREFHVFHRRQKIKSIPIKGIYNMEVGFQDYLTLICEEAKTEWRQVKRLVRDRRLAWARA